MIVSQIDWTPVLVALIPSIPASIAAWRSGLIHRDIQTPSGDAIGHVIERAHETGIANNLLLRKQNGETKEANGEELRGLAHEPLSIPADTDLNPTTEDT